MQKHEMDVYKASGTEVIWTTLGPGALLRHPEVLGVGRSGWIIPVGEGVTHSIVPVLGRFGGRKAWTVAHWVTVDGRDPVRMDTMDQWLEHDKISLAVGAAAEMAEVLVTNPRARVACPWCFGTMDRNELAQGHSCPV